MDCDGWPSIQYHYNSATAKAMLPSVPAGHYGPCMPNSGPVIAGIAPLIPSLLANTGTDGLLLAGEELLARICICAVLAETAVPTLTHALGYRCASWLIC